MSLRTKVIVALRWSAGLRLVSQFASWAMTLVVVRLLSPADYGLMAIAAVIIAFLMLVNELGIGPALVQRKTVDKEIFRLAFGISLLSNLTLFLIIWHLGPLLANFFGETKLVPIVRVLSIQLLLAPFSAIPGALLLRNLDFKRRSFVDLVSNTLGGLTSLILAFLGFGVWSLVWGSMATMSIRTLGLMIASPYFVLPGFSLSGARELLSFGALITTDRLLWFFYSRADVFIVGKFLGTELLGLYTVAMQIASLPMQKVNGIINEIAFPAFSQVQEKQDAVANYLGMATRVICFVAFPIFIGISSVSPIFVEVVLGDKWTETVLPLAILSCVMPLRMVSNVITSTLQGLGRVGVSVGNLIYAATIIPVAILVGVKWGLVGVCVAWLVAFPAVTIIEMLRSRKFVGIGLMEFARFMALPLAGSAIMWFGVVAASQFAHEYSFSVIGLAVTVIVGAIIYLVFTLLFNRQGLKEALSLAKL